MSKLEKIKSIATIIQAVIVSTISIIVYIFITSPESELSKKELNESLSREKAKLIIELLQEEDIDRIRFSYDIIKLSYQLNEDAVWFDDYDALLTEWIKLQESEKQLENQKKALETRLYLRRLNKSYSPNNIIPYGSEEMEDDGAAKKLERTLDVLEKQRNKFQTSSDSIRQVLNSVAVKGKLK